MPDTHPIRPAKPSKAYPEFPRSAPRRLPMQEDPGKRFSFGQVESPGERGGSPHPPHIRWPQVVSPPLRDRQAQFTLSLMFNPCCWNRRNL